RPSGLWACWRSRSRVDPRQRPAQLQPDDARDPGPWLWDVRRGRRKIMGIQFDHSPFGADFGPGLMQADGLALASRRQALEEKAYLDLKARSAAKMALDAAEEARRAEEFGWAREQHARMASVQDAGLGGSPSGAQAPQSPVQGPPAGPDMGPPQPGSPNFEAQLQSSLETHRKLAETMMKIDPVKGAEYADRY